MRYIQPSQIREVESTHKWGKETDQPRNYQRQPEQKYHDGICVRQESLWGLLTPSSLETASQKSLAQMIPSFHQLITLHSTLWISQ